MIAVEQNIENESQDDLTSIGMRAFKESGSIAIDQILPADFFVGLREILQNVDFDEIVEDTFYGSTAHSSQAIICCERKYKVYRIVDEHIVNDIIILNHFPQIDRTSPPDQLLATGVYIIQQDMLEETLLCFNEHQDEPVILGYFLYKGQPKMMYLEKIGIVDGVAKYRIATEDSPAEHSTGTYLLIKTK